MDKVIKLNVVVTVTPGIDYPPFNSELEVSGSDAAGAVWKQTFNVGGTTEVDAIRSIFRSEKVAMALGAIALACSQTIPDFSEEPVPSDKPSVDITPDVPAIPFGYDAIANARTPEQEVQRNDFYDKMTANIPLMKVGLVRKLISDNGLALSFANGANLHDVAEQIVEALKAKEDDDASKNN